MHEILYKRSSAALSGYLNQREFDCKCTNDFCHFTIIDPSTIWSFEKLRDLVDEPIRITSGFRCQKHNLAVGGRKDSYHTTGNALDMVCPDSMDILRFAEKARIFFDFVKVYEDDGVIHCHNVR